MGSFVEDNSTQSTRAEKRWQRILQLPGDTWLKDLTNGKRYQVCDLQAVFHDQYQNSCSQFKCLRTGDHVCVGTLRLVHDGFRCSIGGAVK